ncbi:MAG: helix-turn-helix domain-containing protein [Puniceicoccaceae bacterium]
MHSLGKRLEEARKALGVSLREASEATKIRASYLASFENDDFEIPLPDIYRRGFLKLYARYLKMDVDEVGKEIRVALERRAQIPLRPDGRAGLGQLDIRKEEPGRESEEREAPTTQSRFEKITAPFLRKDDERPETRIDSPKVGSDPFDKDFYVKVGLALGGVIAAVIVLVLLLQLVFSGGSSRGSASNLQSETQAGASEVGAGTGRNVGVSNDVLIVRAGAPTRFVVRDPFSRAILFDQRLMANEERAIPITTKPEIIFSDGTGLRFEFRGKVYPVDRAGEGRILPSSSMFDGLE